MLLHLAPRAESGQPPAGQGSAAVAQSRSDLGGLWPPHVLPHVRAPHLRGGTAAVPEGGQDPPHRAGRGAGRLGRHLARHRDAARQRGHAPVGRARGPQGRGLVVTGYAGDDDLRRTDAGGRGEFLKGTRRYLTTPIYYPSGEPHIGHAYTTILADVLARFWRQDGVDVFFLTGTDEHGQKMFEEANRRGMTPRALSDQMAARFQAAWSELDISFDRFIRTTEPEHIAVVTAFVQRLWDRGEIYEGKYRGWYCVYEERYWTEKDLGPNHACPDCGRPTREIEEKNYFFKMGSYQQRLLDHIRDNPSWIEPGIRRNEILGFLAQPLEDLSISRPKTRVSWGIPLPWDDGHVAYVWVDALINYVTGSGAIDPTRAPAEQGFDDTTDSLWPADLHVMGKDIITTHAVYWPTLLMAAGLPLPRGIFAHGFWVAGEQKMSKSFGNVIDPLELRERFGTDAVRWYLLREMPTGQDASFTPERFLVRYDELANVLGNLASRVLGMTEKYREGRIPDADGTGLDRDIEATRAAIRAAVAEYRLHEALAAAMDLARRANGYVEEREPWAQAKDPARAADLDETLATLARTLAALAAFLQPVCPGKMAELAARLGLSGVPTLEQAVAVRVGGNLVKKGDPLFPRADLLEAASGSAP
ncbi:MAG: methionine--tRNA ligase [Gemmatimonadetes bacterium]|nr:methionine--tRNA ligase [Gemmatimonadota bacterium]